MVLLNDDEPASREIEYIESWSREFDNAFMGRMTNYGWRMEGTHILPPRGNEWWILCLRSDDKYQYATTISLYNPIYKVYFHGLLVAKIKATVFRSSTHYTISWYDNLDMIDTWRHISHVLKHSDCLSLIQDFFIGRKVV